MRLVADSVVVLACGLLAACSSSSIGPASCQTNTPTVANLSPNCDCVFLKHAEPGLTANSASCSVASLGASSVCHYSATTSADGPDVDSACTCFAFSCDQDSAHLSVNCGYFRADDGRDFTMTVTAVPSSACVGQHYCFTPAPSGITNAVCSCQDAPCAAGAQELTSCTDATATSMLEVSTVFPGDVAVSDCRNPSSTIGSNLTASE